jgi:hypothetical protein
MRRAIFILLIVLATISIGSSVVLGFSFPTPPPLLDRFPGLSIVVLPVIIIISGYLTLKYIILKLLERISEVSDNALRDMMK